MPLIRVCFICSFLFVALTFQALFLDDHDLVSPESEMFESLETSSQLLTGHLGQGVGGQIQLGQGRQRVQGLQRNV